MRILTLTGYYLPGYKAGGPIRTLANLVEWLGDDFQIAIVTSDRDLGDKQPYPNVRSGDWHSVGKAQVLYLPPQAFRLLAWRQVLRNLDYDLLYLNSFFSPLTVKTLFLLRIGQISKRPIVLAPRGELSRGALSLKHFKKQLYIHMAKSLGLYKNITWQVSSQYEMQEILSIFGGTVNSKTSFVCIAPNLPPRVTCKTVLQRPLKQKGAAKIVFLSRIARKKISILPSSYLRTLPVKCNLTFMARKRIHYIGKNVRPLSASYLKIFRCIIGMLYLPTR